MIDLHVHTWRCRHAVGDVRDYVDAAARAGVRVLAFTEHLPLAPELARGVPGAEGYAMPPAELDDYVQDVLAIAGYAAEAGVEVLLGIEADLVPVAVDHARAIIERYPFDVVLGSIHMIDGWAFDDPERVDGYASWDVDTLWERYFADVAVAARAGCADVIAHVDLVKKFGYTPSRPQTVAQRELAEALAASGVAVEINTAGLRKPCAELYPSVPLLRALRDAGVPVTVGSDAHAPGEVGAGWSEARDALDDAGYRSVLVFRNRVPQEVGLDGL